MLAGHTANRVVRTSRLLVFFLDYMMRNLLLTACAVIILDTFHKKLKVGILHFYDY
jgi:hypothetical protein